MAGYAGQFLRINLSTGQIDKEKLDLELATKFIGGRGLASYFLAQEIEPDIDALDPANKLIVATGPLTGSRAPTGGRYMVVTKSPLSGTIASSNSGGFWGAELKRAGYDFIIVEGRSDKPCYIHINDETVEIRDAGKYWGKLVGETTDLADRHPTRTQTRRTTATTQVLNHPVSPISNHILASTPCPNSIAEDNPTTAPKRRESESPRINRSNHAPRDKHATL